MIDAVKEDLKIEQIKEMSKILIIDDDRTSRALIKDVFVKRGFKHIKEASNGLDGLKITNEFFPDLIILDINMPVMNGYEYCKKIQEEPTLQNIPVIALTGLSDSEDKKKIFKSGASDYLAKPFDYYEIFARSFLHLERKFFIKELKAYSREIKRELEGAKELQLFSMPSKHDIVKAKESYGITVCAYLLPSNEIGGDFWSFKEVDDDKIAVYNVDFSGHGVNAALNTFRLHTLINSNEMKAITQPNDYVTKLSNSLMKVLPTGSFATMFYGIIDVKNDIMEFCPASSPPPVLISHDKETATLIKSTGFPLGILEDARYEKNKIEFKKGDILVLYSDAFTETTCNNGEFLSEEEFASISFKHFYGKDLTDKLLYNFIKEITDKFAVGITDDMTISVYKRDR